MNKRHLFLSTPIALATACSLWLSGCGGDDDSTPIASGGKGGTSSGGKGGGGTTATGGGGATSTGGGGTTAAGSGGKAGGAGGAAAGAGGKAGGAGGATAGAGGKAGSGGTAGAAGKAGAGGATAGAGGATAGSGGTAAGAGGTAAGAGGTAAGAGGTAAGAGGTAAGAGGTAAGAGGTAAGAGGDTGGGGTAAGGGGAGGAAAGAGGGGAGQTCGVGCATFSVPFTGGNQGVAWAITLDTAGIDLQGATITAQVRAAHIDAGIVGGFQMYIQDATFQSDYGGYKDVNSLSTTAFGPATYVVPATSGTFDTAHSRQVVVTLNTNGTSGAGTVTVWVDSITITPQPTVGNSGPFTFDADVSAIPLNQFNPFRNGVTGDSLTWSP